MKIGKRISSFIENSGFTQREKLIMSAIDYIKNNNQDLVYFEFGVYRGELFGFVYNHAKKLNINGIFIAFDSFEGLPSSEGIYKKGDFKAGKDDFIGNINKMGVDTKNENVIINEGQFKDIKSVYPPPNIIVIDSDLYSSSKQAFDFLNINKIQDKTIIVLDNYWVNTLGERKAFREWVSTNHFETEEFGKYNFGKAFMVCNFKLEGDES